MAARIIHRDRVAINADKVMDVCHEDTNAFGGPLTMWWAEYNGDACCKDTPIERRHIDRADAIAHGKAVGRSKRWKA